MVNDNTNTIYSPETNEKIKRYVDILNSKVDFNCKGVSMYNSLLFLSKYKNLKYVMSHLGFAFDFEVFETSDYVTIENGVAITKETSPLGSLIIAQFLTDKLNTLPYWLDSYKTHILKNPVYITNGFRLLHDCFVWFVFIEQKPFNFEKALKRLKYNSQTDIINLRNEFDTAIILNNLHNTKIYTNFEKKIMLLNSVFKKSLSKIEKTMELNFLQLQTTDEIFDAVANYELLCKRKSFFKKLEFSLSSI